MVHLQPKATAAPAQVQPPPRQGWLSLILPSSLYPIPFCCHYFQSQSPLYSPIDSSIPSHPISIILFHLPEPTPLFHPTPGPIPQLPLFSASPTSYSHCSMPGHFLSIGPWPSPSLFQPAPFYAHLCWASTQLTVSSPTSTPSP